MDIAEMIFKKAQRFQSNGVLHLRNVGKNV
jgi:hypothetical protein